MIDTTIPNEVQANKFESSLQAGYSKSEVVGHLSQSEEHQSKISEAKQAGYSDDEIFDYLSGQEAPVEPIQEAPIVVEPEVPGTVQPTDVTTTMTVDEMKEQEFIKAGALADKYHAMMDKYSTTAKKITGMWNREYAMSAQQDISDLNSMIAKKLQDQGLDVYIAQNNQLYMNTDEGPRELESSMLNDMINRKGEFASAIGGAMLGATVPGGPWAKAAGALVGGATGAMAGRGTDVVLNAMELKEKLEGEFVWSQMKDAGIADAVLGVVGTTVFKLGAAGARAIKGAFDLVVKGSSEQAYKTLIKDMFIIDSEAKQIVNKWEVLNKAQAPGATAKEKALSILPTTQPGGEAFVQAASVFDTKASLVVSNQINQRAQDLLKSTKGISFDRPAKDFVTALDSYANDVMSYFGKVKQMGIDEMGDRTIILTDDIEHVLNKTASKHLTTTDSKEALQAILNQVRDTMDEPTITAVERIGGKKGAYDQISTVTKPTTETITEKAVVKEGRDTFTDITKRVEGRPYEATVSFEKLLKLRSIVSDFKNNNKLVSPQDYAPVNAVLNSLDAEIKNAAKEGMTDSKLWLDQWKKANKEYAKFGAVKKNELIKALGIKFHKDISGNFERITAKKLDDKLLVDKLVDYVGNVDNTFTQVLEKLPAKIQTKVEGVVLDTLINKYTAGNIGEMRAVQLPMLAKQLEGVHFQSPKAKQMKRVIGRMAEVFRNDVNLARASGTISIPKNQSFLTTDIVMRGKYELATSIFNHINRLKPTESGRALNLVHQLGKVLEQPLSNKAVKELMRNLPKDERIVQERLIKGLQQEFVKSGSRTTESITDIPWVTEDLKGLRLGINEARDMKAVDEYAERLVKMAKDKGMKTNKKEAVQEILTHIKEKCNGM